MTGKQAGDTAGQTAGTADEAGRETAAGDPRVLTLDDVLDLRAYERVRDRYRQRIVAHKRLRRIPLGPVLTLVFESFDTVRFQVQEMARAERMMTDEAIQGELDVYNKLLPGPGELSATLFIELTSDAELRQWLPALVGIERSLALEVGPGARRVTGVPEQSHEESLTRETVTAAVHYVRFPVGAGGMADFSAGPVVLVADHPAYQARTELSEETTKELLRDLSGASRPLEMS